jgi:hypothetical protein
VATQPQVRPLIPATERRRQQVLNFQPIWQRTLRRPAVAALTSRVLRDRLIEFV